MKTQQHSPLGVPRFCKFPISSEIDPFNVFIPKKRVTESNNRRLGCKQLANDDAKSMRLYGQWG
eukprot:scaffold21499_cov60-Attheya_sp.AAC.6